MTTALLPLQKAVRDKLLADAPLMDLITGVLDRVKETQPRPYVVYGSAIEVPDDAHNQRGLTVNLTLDIWSEHPGFLEAGQIHAAVDAALDRKPLTVAGFRDVSIAYQQAQELRDPDPKLRHVSVSYRVWMTKEEE
jgi:hypothetical protein